MTNTDFVIVCYLLEEKPDVSEVVDYLMEDLGCGLLRTQDVPFETRVEELKKEGEGNVAGIAYEETRFILGIYEEDGERGITPDLPTVSLSMSRGYADDEEEVESVVDLSKKMYEFLQSDSTCHFCYGGYLSPDPTSMPIPSKKKVLNSTFEYVYWLNILPPRMADNARREWLLTAPAWKVEPLDDGSILLVSSDNPHVTGEHDIHMHLGLERTRFHRSRYPDEYFYTRED